MFMSQTSGQAEGECATVSKTNFLLTYPFFCHGFNYPKNINQTKNRV